MAVHTGSSNELRSHSTGELVKHLSEQASTLARQEVELAKAELTEKAKTAGIGAGMFGGAGLLGLLAVGALTASLILALDEGMPSWLAALIVAVVYGAAAVVVALVGRDRVKEAMPPAPQETIESVKEDVQWAKTRARSART